ncbi:hypothetical protein LCGC14_2187440 [marine sediment metagenome]|uniref:Uncharacterized protein n=1 Tax=marine sediment metagenome TaxID=412755 RepID=A0A0F9DKQ7_9ZZZZ
MNKLVCDRCEAEYTDEDSIIIAKSYQEQWKASCIRDGKEPRGIAPCPIFACPGELILEEA